MSCRNGLFFSLFTIEMETRKSRISAQNIVPSTGLSISVAMTHCYKRFFVFGKIVAEIESWLRLTPLHGNTFISIEIKFMQIENRARPNDKTINTKQKTNIWRGKKNKVQADNKMNLLHWILLWEDRITYLATYIYSLLDCLRFSLSTLSREYGSSKQMWKVKMLTTSK